MKFKLETDRQTTMLTCNMPDCKDADTLSKSDSSKNAATKRFKNSSFLGIGLGTLAMAGCSVMRVLWGIYIIGHSWGFSFTHTSPPTASWIIDTHSQHLTVHWISNAEWAVAWWLQQPQEKYSILLVCFYTLLSTRNQISSGKLLYTGDFSEYCES